MIHGGSGRVDSSDHQRTVGPAASICVYTVNQVDLRSLHARIYCIYRVYIIVHCDQCIRSQTVLYTVYIQCISSGSIGPAARVWLNHYRPRCIGIDFLLDSMYTI